MQLTRFGRTGMSVSRLCLGTATFGKQTDEAESHRILDAGADRGINFLDTAYFYPMGAAHTQLGGTALAQRQAPPLYRRVKSRGADEPATLEPGRLAQAPARCDRRLAAPSRHRLRRSISAASGRSHKRKKGDGGNY